MLYELSIKVWEKFNFFTILHLTNISFLASQNPCWNIGDLVCATHSGKCSLYCSYNFPMHSWFLATWLCCYINHTVGPLNLAFFVDKLNKIALEIAGTAILILKHKNGFNLLFSIFVFYYFFSLSDFHFFQIIFWCVCGRPW